MVGSAVQLEFDLATLLAPLLQAATTLAASFFRGAPLNDHELYETWTRRSIDRASTVSCLGMSHPVPISKIYQATRLRSSWDGKEVEPSSLLPTTTSAVFVGMPGSGKSTLLHWLFLELVRRNDSLPFLFTLRREDAIAELEHAIEILTRLRALGLLSRGLPVLVVDGYDEVGYDLRRKVSALLQRAESDCSAVFVLSCRRFYSMVDLGAPRYDVLGFRPRDAARFVAAFKQASGSRFDVRALITELRAKNFASFLESPLLLTLACILKSSSLVDLPARPLSLIRSALDVLRLRWDYERGVRRETAFQIEGEERLRCLSRIAFASEDLEIAEAKVVGIAERFLSLAGQAQASATDFLLELAQWYGILIPAESGVWAFGHRTIHDFLAARYWVSSGQFNPHRVEKWTPRAAYAATMVEDATAAICSALRGRELFAVVEMLANGAAYQTDVIAAAIVDYYRQSPEVVVLQEDKGRLNAATNTDLFEYLNPQSLTRVVEGALDPATNLKLRKFCLAFALAELKRRRVKVAGKMAERIGTMLDPVFELSVQRRNEKQVFMLPSPDADEEET